MSLVIIVICIILLFLLGIEFLIIAFRESVLWGLACFFFQPVNFFFLIVHWDKTKRNFFKTLAVIFVLFVTVFFSSFGTDEVDSPIRLSKSKNTIQSVLSNKMNYSGASVFLRGRVSDYKQKVSRKGNRYTVFTLRDGTGAMTVHYRGHAGSYNGQYVAVKGTFNAVTHVSGRSYYNQIEASSVAGSSQEETSEDDALNHALANEKYRAFQKTFATPKKQKLIKVGGGRKVSSNSLLLTVHKNKLKKMQVSGFGKVKQILTDDLKGDQHQRFILEITPELTILIAHNIDLAPRVSPLKVGDVIHFYGQYEWNSEGGVVHWTHKDPDGKHKHGWLERNHKKFQ